MAIDYFSLFPCKVREALPGDELLTKIKMRNQANMVLDVMRNDPQVSGSGPESEWKVKTVTFSSDGPKERVVSISDLLREAAPLDALGVHCSGCAANVRNTTFGCGGAIHYPISAEAEHWLLSRLPSDLSSPRGSLLTRAIADFRYDGAVIDAGRRRKEIYAAGEPVERQWGGFLRKKTRINSSQMLQMSFAVGNLPAAHAKLVAYIVGFLNDAFDVANTPMNLPQPEDDAAIIEFKQFFRVAALAGAQNLSVFVDA
jgi:hypothetical protein